MRISFALILAATAAICHAKVKKNDQPVEVKLRVQKGSTVTLTLTNKGQSEANFFRRATILDINPIRRVNITSASGEPLDFVGAHPRVLQENLQKDSFQSLKGGKSIKVTFDLADIYDISDGGSFEVSTVGGIPWAKKKSTKLEGHAPYSSNTITVDVPKSDGDKQSPALKARNNFVDDCQGDHLASTKSAYSVCSVMALNAVENARNGSPDIFSRYFGTSDPNMRNLVANRLQAVSDECAGITTKAITFCTDQMQLCHSDYISVTLGNKITMCDIFWTFPVLTNSCHGYDQATIAIHETTHVDGLYDPSTVDYENNSGYPSLTYLPADQAVTNAANYQYYANAVYVGNGC